MLMGCLICVICDSSSFHSFIFKLNMLWLLTHWTCVHPVFWAYLIIFLGLLNLDIITSTPLLDYLCLICNSNRFHSFIFKFCIMIVNTLKMCTGDAGPEQSLVLFLLVWYNKLGMIHCIHWWVTCYNFHIKCVFLWRWVFSQQTV